MKASKFILSTSILALVCAVGTSLPASAQFVNVGNPGNPNDPASGGLDGGVGYIYAIGTYEVTLSQYTAFLNAVAATDTYDLYNVSMMDPNIAGISRTGSSGSYAYSVIPGSGNKPVTQVSFYDAMRYVNWLGTGNTETGAYTLLGGTAVPSNGETVTRNGGAQYWIPSYNEWYKAAYYDPTKGGSDYWLFPTRSDSTPGNNIGAGVNQANYLDSVTGYSVTQSDTLDPLQNYLTDVGVYTDSASYYGTYDQGGNVWEWNDTNYGNGYRGLNGGWWGGDVPEMSSSVPDAFDPTFEYSGHGFRVASVPEPTSAVLLLGGGALLALRRRRSPAGALMSTKPNCQ